MAHIGLPLFCIISQLLLNDEPPRSASATSSTSTTRLVLFHDASSYSLLYAHSPSMDIAYDHIQEENFKEDPNNANRTPDTQTNLNQEFQEAYKAISSSPWGA